MSLSKQLMFDEMEEDELLDGNEEDGEPAINEEYVNQLKTHIRDKRNLIRQLHAALQDESLRVHRLQDFLEGRMKEGLNLDKDRPEDLHFRVLKGSA